jgi:hypothetical protein
VTMVIELSNRHRGPAASKGGADRLKATQMLTKDRRTGELAFLPAEHGRVPIFEPVAGTGRAVIGSFRTLG